MKFNLFLLFLINFTALAYIIISFNYFINRQILQQVVLLQIITINAIATNANASVNSLRNIHTTGRKSL